MIPLRDYQIEMHRRLLQAWERHRSVMVQMSTGTGKTYLLAAVVHEALADAGASGTSSEVWIITHRRELVSQIEETLDRYAIPRGKGRARVFSIQWLSRNQAKIGGDSPSLIIIDEAHHALAESYQALWSLYPDARKLGMTATPCRLNHRGFTDLFELLLQSWSIPEFIQKGVLSSFDYFSIRPDSREQHLIDNLQKRGSDGDYQIKEMDAVLNRRASIGQLYRSLEQHAPGRKGIVYAISIDHARQIATYYNNKGIVAVALDSRTPANLRKEQVEAFRQGKIQVLVNVDLFSEGFDCPDVEFIQLARPTLSLAKYLQQVGRGLRRSKGKEACILIDNVGLHRLFGLPTCERDWQALFEGRMRGKAATTRRSSNPNRPITFRSSADKASQELELVISHDRLFQEESLHYSEILHYGSIELQKIGDCLCTRTRQVYRIEPGIRPEQIRWRGFYVEIPCSSSPRGMQRCGSRLGSLHDSVCLLEGDDSAVYHLCGILDDWSIIVMDDEGNYYHVEEGRAKRYIASHFSTSVEDSFEHVIPLLEQGVRRRMLQQEQACERRKKKKREERLRQVRGDRPFAATK